MLPLPGPLQIPALAAAIACVVATSLACARLLRVERTLPLSLAVAVLSCAQVVIVLQVLSSLHSIAALPLLLAHAAPLAALTAAGVRPVPLRPRARLVELWSSLSAGRAPAVLLLAATTTATACVLLYLVVAVSPNNYDGLQYHLTRAYTYVQQQSLAAYPTPDLRETVLPANAELLVMWPLVFWPQERTAGLVQLLAWFGSGATVVGLARRLGFPAPSSALAGLVFLSLPGVLLQATSTQVDLTVAFFVLCAFYWAASPDPPDALLGGLALGLALGTKSTAAFALPGLVLWAVAWTRRAGGPGRVRRLALGALCGVVGFAACGAGIYLRNVQLYGHPSGPAPFRAMVTLNGHEPRVLRANLVRLSLRLLDPGGVTVPGSAASVWMAEAYARLSGAVLLVAPADTRHDFAHENSRWTPETARRVNEDLTVFGPLFAPLLLLAGVRAGRRRDAAALALLAAAVLYLVAVACLLRWQIWHGRFLVTLAALAAPVLAAALPTRGHAATVGTLLVAAACVSAQVTCGFFNERKPLVGVPVWKRDRIAQMGWFTKGQETLLRMLEARRRQPATVALFAKDPGDLRAPFFGPRLGRRVVAQRVVRPEDASLARLVGFDAVVVANEQQAAFRDRPPPPGDAGAPFWTVADLRPLLSELRAPGSPFRAVVDNPLTGSLFVRSADGLSPPPDFADVTLEGGWWDDGWVGPRAVRLVRAGGGRLLVEGEILDIGALGERRLSLGLAGGPLVQRTLAPGPFRLELALGRAAVAAEFAAVEIRCEPFYNPFTAGVSADDRDLAWRVVSLRFGGAEPSAAAPAVP